MAHLRDAWCGADDGTGHAIEAAIELIHIR